MAKYGKMMPNGNRSAEESSGKGNLHSGSIHTHGAPHCDGKDQFADHAGSELGWASHGEQTDVGKMKHNAHDKETGFIKR